MAIIKANQCLSNDQSSTVISANEIHAQMQNVLNITIGNSIATSKKVAIIPGWEYRFVFFDANSNKRIDCIALVEEVFTDCIKVIAKNKPKNSMNCSICMNTECTNRRENYIENSGPIPSCECFVSNTPNTDSYRATTMYYIPINNLMLVEYIKKNKPINKEKGVKVVLLGITATTLRALILHLEFFDDHQENAVKYVNIEVGGTYNFVYECGGRRSTTYELEGKVLSIEEVKENPCNTNKRFVRTAGTGDTVYESCSACASTTPKEEFIKGVPVKAVKIVVDASTVFESRIETIMLDSIRDCVQIKSAHDESDEIVMDPCENCEYATCDCDPETCEYYNNMSGNPTHPIKSKVYSFDISDDIKVDVIEDKAKVMVKGKEPVYVPLDEILRFYLGDGCEYCEGESY